MLDNITVVQNMCVRVQTNFFAILNIITSPDVTSKPKCLYKVDVECGNTKLMRLSNIA